MQYSAEIPTQEGYYWFQTINPSGGRMDRIVRVVKDGETLSVRYEQDSPFNAETSNVAYGFTMEQWLAHAVNCEPQWAGPIQHPA